MSHIVSTLKAPNGVRVKLLGETHAKNFTEEQKCNVHIDDEKVTDILFESAKISKFGKFMLSTFRKIIRFDESTSSIVHARYFRNTRCKILDKHQLDQNDDEMHTKKIKYHDLEKDNNMYIGDELPDIALISVTGLTLTPFAKRYPKIVPYVFIPILGYGIMNLLFSKAMTPFSYPVKSKLSEWLVCDTILYRRDKIMADSIIEHAKNKIQKDDNLSLCIFGSAHHEGICYYLQKNGFTFFAKPVKF